MDRKIIDELERRELERKSERHHNFSFGFTLGVIAGMLYLMVLQTIVDIIKATGQ